MLFPAIFRFPFINILPASTLPVAVTNDPINVAALTVIAFTVVTLAIDPFIVDKFELPVTESVPATAKVF